MQKAAVETTLIVGNERLTVRGRLAAVLGYLAGHQSELSLDASDQGSLRVDYGSANIRASVVHFLPGLREPA